MPQPTNEAETSSPGANPMPEAQLKTYLADVGVPARYWSARLFDFDVDMPKMNDSGLYLYGDNGTGKTHMAAAFLADRLPGLIQIRTVLSNGIPTHSYVERYNAHFVVASDFLERIKESYNKDSDITDKNIFDEVANVPLLVLDDLGAEQLTDWSLSMMRRLIQKRIDYYRPTIVTSNLRQNEINKYDPRLASRLGGMTYYHLEGDDRRMERKGMVE